MDISGEKAGEADSIQRMIDETNKEEYSTRNPIGASMMVSMSLDQKMIVTKKMKDIEYNMINIDKEREERTYMQVQGPMAHSKKMFACLPSKSNQLLDDTIEEIEVTKR